VTFSARNMLRNETLYPNASVFDPDRFSNNVPEDLRRKRDPRNYIFGFGRRLACLRAVYDEAQCHLSSRCPGSDLVESSIWILVVTMIATLSIRKLRSRTGDVVEPVITFRNTFFR
jgi:cytochrome P450